MLGHTLVTDTLLGREAMWKGAGLMLLWPPRVIRIRAAPVVAPGMVKSTWRRLAATLLPAGSQLTPLSREYSTKKGSVLP